MKFQKKMLAVLAAGALTAAAAVPAMALENEFHGMFRVNGIVSNYANGGSGQLTPTANGTDPQTKSYVEQRARILYAAKANDDLKLVTHFEIDSRWGDNSYGSNGITTSSSGSPSFAYNGRNNGGALGADHVNLETKSVYLDFNIPTTPVNFKVGIQPIIDSYKGIFYNADAAAVIASAKMGNGQLTLGFSRFDDRNGAVSATTSGAVAGNVSATDNVGKATRDLYIIDGKYNVNKDLKVGGSYYVLLQDQKTASSNLTLHTLGVNAELKLEPATIDAFLLYQNGRTHDTKVDFGGWAAQVAAKGKLGPGTARVAFLYASGEQNNNPDSSAFAPVNNQTSSAFAEQSYYPAEMMIMMRNKYNVGDKAVVYSTSNVIAGFVGYDYARDKFLASANAGFLAADKNNDDFGAKAAWQTKHDSHYLGTELNAEVGYKLFDNMTASLQGAYVILGDYYKDTLGTATDKRDPRNPYITRVMLNYVF